MVVLNKGNLEKLDMLVGFVNAIVYMVSNPDEHLSPNCHGTSVLSIGYYRDDNDSLHLANEEMEEKKTDFKNTLKEVEKLLKQSIKEDFTKQWEDLN